MPKKGMSKTMPKKGMSQKMPNKIMQKSSPKKALQKAFAKNGMSKTMPKKGMSQKMPNKIMQKSSPKKALQKAFAKKGMSKTMPKNGNTTPTKGKSGGRKMDKKKYTVKAGPKNGKREMGPTMKKGTNKAKGGMMNMGPKSGEMRPKQGNTKMVGQNGKSGVGPKTGEKVMGPNRMEVEDEGKIGGDSTISKNKNGDITKMKHRLDESYTKKENIEPSPGAVKVGSGLIAGPSDMIVEDKDDEKKNKSDRMGNQKDKKAKSKNPFPMSKSSKIKAILGKKGGGSKKMSKKDLKAMVKKSKGKIKVVQKKGKGKHKMGSKVKIHINEKPSGINLGPKDSVLNMGKKLLENSLPPINMEQNMNMNPTKDSLKAKGTFGKRMSKNNAKSHNMLPKSPMETISLPKGLSKMHKAVGHNLGTNTGSSSALGQKDVISKANQDNLAPKGKTGMNMIKQIKDQFPTSPKESSFTKNDMGIGSKSKNNIMGKGGLGIGSGMNIKAKNTNAEMINMNPNDNVKGIKHSSPPANYAGNIGSTDASNTLNMMGGKNSFGTVGTQNTINSNPKSVKGINHANAKKSLNSQPAMKAQHTKSSKMHVKGGKMMGSTSLNGKASMGPGNNIHSKGQNVVIQKEVGPIGSGSAGQSLPHAINKPHKDNMMSDTPGKQLMAGSKSSISNGMVANAKGTTGGLKRTMSATDLAKAGAKRTSPDAVMEKEDGMIGSDNS